MNLKSVEDATILIVDDNPNNLSVLFDYLNTYGFHILVCQTGESALQLSTTEDIDLILLDVMMPGIDGFETCRRLKANETTKEIPVIFMSALSETVDKVRGFKAGGVDYITKPFQQEELLARIYAHLTIRKQQKKLNELIIQLNEKNKILKKLSIQDGLTNMYNQTYILQQLENEVKKSQRYGNHLSIVMLDVDFFKKINDSFGHPVGDWVLKTIADTIRNSIREVDIAGRYGGEEFLIIMPETTESAAYHVAERLRKNVEQINWSIEGLAVTVSGGIKGYESENHKKFLVLADQRLYQAKQNGRNNIYPHIIE